MDVLLVDKDDKVIGKEEKLKAHKLGLLHRAFSVFIFNSKKELLIQKRAKGKYHSSGKWTNTCCSHPLDEDTLSQAKARLKEEMGLDCELKEIFSFVYTAKVDELIENEFDHVFVGRTDKNPTPNIKEVSNWRWTSLDRLKTDVENNPDDYTPWLRLCLDDVAKHFGR